MINEWNKQIEVNIAYDSVNSFKVKIDIYVWRVEGLYKSAADMPCYVFEYSG